MDEHEKEFIRRLIERPTQEQMDLLLERERERWGTGHRMLLAAQSEAVKLGLNPRRQVGDLVLRQGRSCWIYSIDADGSYAAQPGPELAKQLRETLDLLAKERSRVAEFEKDGRR